MYIAGITNTVGRILSGVFADFKSVNSLMLNNVCMLIAGLSIVLAPFAESYATLVIVASIFGLTTGLHWFHVYRINLTLICTLMEITSADGSVFTL